MSRKTIVEVKKPFIKTVRQESRNTVEDPSFKPNKFDVMDNFEHKVLNSNFSRPTTNPHLCARNENLSETASNGN